MGEIRLLDRDGLGKLHIMMLEEDFPNVPLNFYDAYGYFEDCKVFGMFNKTGDLIAGFIFGVTANGSAFFDAVCNRKYKGKWASKKVLQKLYELAFIELGLKFVWAETVNLNAIKALISAGFVALNPCDEHERFKYVLTPNNLNYKFKINY